MAIALKIDGAEVSRHEIRSITSRPAGQGTDELFRWACFLDQGDAVSLSRERAVQALVDAADADASTLRQAWSYGLDARREGVATRRVVELLEDALRAARALDDDLRLSTMAAAERFAS